MYFIKRNKAHSIWGTLEQYKSPNHKRASDIKPGALPGPICIGDGPQLTSSLPRAAAIECIGGDCF